jgi:hypothetical protein
LFEWIIQPPILALIFVLGTPVETKIIAAGEYFYIPQLAGNWFWPGKLNLFESLQPTSHLPWGFEVDDPQVLIFRLKQQIRIGLAVFTAGNKHETQHAIFRKKSASQGLAIPIPQFFLA